MFRPTWRNCFLRFMNILMKSGSPVVRLEVAVDDGDWRTVSPEGGIGDSRSAAFAFVLADLKAGEHLVSVRAIDLAGNSATKAIHVKVAAGR